MPELGNGDRQYDGLQEMWIGSGMKKVIWVRDNWETTLQAEEMPEREQDQPLKCSWRWSAALCKALKVQKETDTTYRNTHFALRGRQDADSRIPRVLMQETLFEHCPPEMKQECKMSPIKQTMQRRHFVPYTKGLITLEIHNLSNELDSLIIIIPTCASQQVFLPNKFIINSGNTFLTQRF